VLRLATQPDGELASNIVGEHNIILQLSQGASYRTKRSHTAANEKGENDVSKQRDTVAFSTSARAIGARGGMCWICTSIIRSVLSLEQGSEG
jgi:hypothetical protein